MADGVTRATYDVSEEELGRMPLEREQLPEEFKEFEPFREGPLDNASLAEEGFPGNTADSFREMGRITGYLREFAAASDASFAEEGDSLMVGTVVHLFQDEQAVSRWMTDLFLKQFEENVGKPTQSGQQLIAAEQVEVGGLHGETVAVRAVQEGPQGPISSTVVDFRIGRLLGVAFVVSVGDVERSGLVGQVAGGLERQMMRVVLGAA